MVVTGGVKTSGPDCFDPYTPHTSNRWTNVGTGVSNWMDTEHTDSFPDSEMSSRGEKLRSPSTHENDDLGGFLTVPS